MTYRGFLNPAAWVVMLGQTAAGWMRPDWIPIVATCAAIELGIGALFYLSERNRARSELPAGELKKLHNEALPRAKPSAWPLKRRTQTLSNDPRAVAYNAFLRMPSEANARMVLDAWSKHCNEAAEPTSSERITEVVKMLDMIRLLNGTLASLQRRSE